MNFTLANIAATPGPVIFDDAGEALSPLQKQFEDGENFAFEDGELYEFENA